MKNTQIIAKMSKVRTHLQINRKPHSIVGNFTSFHQFLPILGRDCNQSLPANLLCQRNWSLSPKAVSFELIFLRKTYRVASSMVMGEI